MTAQGRVLRTAGMLALWAGYGAGLVLRGWRGAQARLLPRRHWRRVQIGHLRVQLPGDWGSLEPAADGGFVIHNRPRQFRVDGDAVWYATAVELRIRRPGMAGVARLTPMTETCRTIKAREGAIVVALAIANGVGPSKRREAQRVLASARGVRSGQPLRWPASP